MTTTFTEGAGTLRRHPRVAAGVGCVLMLAAGLLLSFGGGGPSSAIARQIDAFRTSTEICLTERTTTPCSAPYDHLHDIAQAGWCRDETNIRSSGYRGFHPCPDTALR